LDHFQFFTSAYDKAVKVDASLIRLVVVGFILSVQLELIGKDVQLSFAHQQQAYISIDDTRAVYGVHSDPNSKHMRCQYIFKWSSPSGNETYNKTDLLDSDTDNCTKFILNRTKIRKVKHSNCDFPSNNPHCVDITKLKYTTSYLIQCVKENNIRCISMEIQSFLTIRGG